MRTTLLLFAALAATGCRKPDTGRPDTGGPLVVVEAPDVVSAAVGLDAASPSAGGYCVENWRVTIPPRARLLDLAWVDTQAVLLLEQEGTFIAVVVGGGGQAAAAVLQDFVPEFVGEQAPFGRLVQKGSRTLALYGWVRAREAAQLFGRVVRTGAVLSPAAEADGVRRRYFSARPRPDWELPGDPTVPESRLWTAGFESRFLVVLDLWQRDRIDAGRVTPVKKHLFALFGGTGKRAGGWDLRASRGAPPAVLGDRLILAVSSRDRQFEVLDGGGRRKQEPLLDALKADPSWVPLVGGCFPDAPAAPAADGGTAAPDCFALLQPVEPPVSGLPPVRALRADGTAFEWRLPVDLAETSTFETLADGLLWARAPDGSMWAAGPDGVVVQRTILPPGARLRRCSRQELLAAVGDGPLGPNLVVSCVPGGASAEPARGVALEGTVAQARRDASGPWNEGALAALDAIEQQLATGTTPDPERLAELATFDDARRMATRSRTLDPDNLVAALSAARAEVLADDPAAALREFAAIEGAEPSRRERLVRLACTDGRFAALRWNPDLGARLGCPEAPPAWFILLRQGGLPAGDAGLPALGPLPGTEPDAGAVVPDAEPSPDVEPPPDIDARPLVPPLVNIVPLPKPPPDATLVPAPPPGGTP
ncbi:MAG: hypothetical protein JXB32_14170 [Deltaproteobacteria bacterium]|nr:hypothetical protein [Deltaproteobacteria bacterium]